MYGYVWWCGILGGVVPLDTAVVGDEGKVFEWRCAGTLTYAVKLDFLIVAYVV